MRELFTLSDLITLTVCVVIAVTVAVVWPMWALAAAATLCTWFIKIAIWRWPQLNDYFNDVQFVVLVNGIKLK